ncbi:MAG: 50S ribosomal protein L1 [Candidatus Woesearchaeota archaeon]
MDKKQIEEALKKAKEGQERKFKQSIDLIVNLKDLNLKNPEEQVEFFVNMQHSNGKKHKVCCLSGPELLAEAKAHCDTVLEQHDFEKLDKKQIKKLSQEHDWFIAQANIMPKVATTFGRVLGPRGKMPNPKAGCVVPPKAALGPLTERLQNTLKVSAKKAPTIMLKAGHEGQDEKEIVDNILLLYDQIVHHLPNEANNIRSVLLKTTMGAPVKLQ